MTRHGVRGRGQPRPRRSSRLALLALLAGALSGCDTITQDFQQFFTDIVPPTPAQAAEWALDPYDAENRRRGTTLLANAPWGGSDVYLKLYRDRVENETDPQVIAISIRALARHGDASDAVLISRRLESVWRDVRWEAALGLQRLHNPAVTAALARRVADELEDPDVREAATVALGQYAEDASFQALVAALDARELSINLAAQAALLTLTGRDFGLDRTAWLDWYRRTPNPFEDQQVYRYPTYSRPLTVWDHLAFWSPTVFESPDVPVGMTSGRRSTYESVPAGGDTTGSSNATATEREGAATGNTATGNAAASTPAAEQGAAERGAAPGESPSPAPRP